MPWNEHAFSSSKPLVVGVWVTSEVNQYLSYFVVMVSLGALQLSNSLIFWVVAGFQRIFLNVGSVLIFKSPLIAHLFLCSCDTPCGIPLLFDTQCLLASCWGLWNFIACCNEAPVLGRHCIPGSWGRDQISAPVPSLVIVLKLFVPFPGIVVFFFFFPLFFTLLPWVFYILLKFSL